jgi:type IV pilus assembly protein PilX
MHMIHRSAPRTRQAGVILFVSLMLLVILSLLAVTAARMQTVEERIARNEDNRQISAAVAEATLRAVEAGLQTGVYVNFGSSVGLYDLTADMPTYNGSVVPTLNWTDTTRVLTYTGGPALAAYPTPIPAPKFVIESLPPVVSKGNALNGSKARPVYRITVQAVGADQTSTTTVQSIVHY